MRYDRLLVFLTVPTIELNATTTGQKHSPIHFHRRFPAKLAPNQVSVVRRVDKVVTQRLLHVLVDVEPVQEHGRIVVRHQIVVEALYAHLLACLERLVGLVRVYDAEDAIAVVVGKDDLVEAWVALKLVAKLD